jgi:hypothetical protein
MVLDNFFQLLTIHKPTSHLNPPGNNNCSCAIQEHHRDTKYSFARVAAAVCQKFTELDSDTIECQGLPLINLICHFPSFLEVRTAKPIINDARCSDSIRHFVESFFINPMCKCFICSCTDDSNQQVQSTRLSRFEPPKDKFSLSK